MLGGDRLIPVLARYDSYGSKPEMSDRVEIEIRSLKFSKSFTRYTDSGFAYHPDRALASVDRVNPVLLAPTGTDPCRCVVLRGLRIHFRDQAAKNPANPVVLSHSFMRSAFISCYPSASTVLSHRYSNRTPSTTSLQQRRKTGRLSCRSSFQRTIRRCPHEDPPGLRATALGFGQVRRDK